MTIWGPLQTKEPQGVLMSLASTQSEVQVTRFGALGHFTNRYRYILDLERGSVRCRTGIGASPEKAQTGTMTSPNPSVWQTCLQAIRQGG